MVKTALLLLIIFISSLSFSQDSALVMVNAGTSIEESIPLSQLYYYPQFQPGKVYYRDGKIAVSMMNHHQFLDEIHFINPTSDTLAIANPSNIRLMIIGVDTFYHDKGFVMQFSGNDVMKIAKKGIIRIVDRSKKGGYGMDNPASAITSYNSFYDVRGTMFKLAVNENITLLKEVVYYFGDKYNHFLPATRNNLLDLFSKQQQTIKNYLNENKVDFKNLSHLVKLAEFIKTLYAY